MYADSVARPPSRQPASLVIVDISVGNAHGSVEHTGRCGEQHGLHKGGAAQQVRKSRVAVCRTEFRSARVSMDGMFCMYMYVVILVCRPAVCGDGWVAPRPQKSAVCELLPEIFAPPAAFIQTPHALQNAQVRLHGDWPPLTATPAAHDLVGRGVVPHSRSPQSPFPISNQIWLPAGPGASQVAVIHRCAWATD